VAQDTIPGIVQVLNGLSLKSAQEIVQLTMARTGAIQPKEIRRTRMMLGGSTPGLHALDTDYDFYVMPPALKSWLDLNDKYFLEEGIPDKLRPRGLMLVGDPGVGKSMFSLVLAKHWDVPLFRLDISASKNRYLGETESRIARHLSTVDQNAPCVWLFDEVEKIFGVSDNEGTMSSVLTQVLWWLQMHKSRVFTVMTSNNLKTVPGELYRPGRIDKTVEIQKLTLSEAKIFAGGVYRSVVGHDISLRRQKVLRDTLDKMNKGSLAHAEVTETVYTLIKERSWLEEDK
jgi:ATP-dependent 26S proteasome regulatory subunit